MIMYHLTMESTRLVFLHQTMFGPELPFALASTLSALPCSLGSPVQSCSLHHLLQSLLPNKLLHTWIQLSVCSQKIQWWRRISELVSHGKCCRLSSHHVWVLSLFSLRFETLTQHPVAHIYFFFTPLCASASFHYHTSCSLENATVHMWENESAK